MSLHGISGRDENCPFSEFVALLRESCETTSRFQGGDPYYIEEVQIFKQIARDQDYLLKEAPVELNTPCDDFGNEHQEWFNEGDAIYLKATWADNFGMKVVYLPHEERKASPIDYLERWLLHNQVFGDSVKFLGILETSEGMRLLITQPAILGEPATVAQINGFFMDKGWIRIEIEKDVAYFDRERGMIISDTHRGNIISLENGLLLPIDLRVQKLNPTLLNMVESLL